MSPLVSDEKRLANFHKWSQDFIEPDETVTCGVMNRRQPRWSRALLRGGGRFDRLAVTTERNVYVLKLRMLPLTKVEDVVFQAPLGSVDAAVQKGSVFSGPSLQIGDHKLWLYSGIGDKQCLARAQQIAEAASGTAAAAAPEQ